MRSCHSSQRHRELHAREVRAEAAVRAAAEGEVAVALALEVDALGVAELARRRRSRRRSAASPARPSRARRRRSSTSCFTTRGTAMTGVSQRSSSSTASGISSGFVDDAAALLGVRGEVRHVAAERRGHGVEAGEQQQEADVEDLVAREALAVDLGLRADRSPCRRAGCARRSSIDVVEVGVDLLARVLAQRAARPRPSGCRRAAVCGRMMPFLSAGSSRSSDCGRPISARKAVARQRDRELGGRTRTRRAR